MRKSSDESTCQGSLNRPRSGEVKSDEVTAPVACDLGVTGSAIAFEFDSKARDGVVAGIGGESGTIINSTFINHRASTTIILNHLPLSRFIVTED